MLFKIVTSINKYNNKIIIRTFLIENILPFFKSFHIFNDIKLLPPFGKIDNII